MKAPNIFFFFFFQVTLLVAVVQAVHHRNNYNEHRLMSSVLQQEADPVLRSLEESLLQKRRRAAFGGGGTTVDSRVVLDESTQPHRSTQPTTSRRRSLQPPKDKYTFAVVPKQYITFFEPTEEGCHDHAVRLSKANDVTVECLYVGPSKNANRGQVQADIVQELLFPSDGSPTTIDALAISVVDAELMTPIMDRAVTELGIPVVTFDSDAPESKRSYYIGTNNSFFGRQLGRQMESLNPSGGTYGIIAGESVNLQARANGIIQELMDQTSNSDTGNTWEQLPDSPFDALNNQTLAIEKMNEWAKDNPTVLLSVTGLPMRIVTNDDGTSYAPWTQFVDDNRHRNITLLCADASAPQLQFLKYDYIDGLAGQLPYDMGIRSMDALWTLLQDPDAPSLADDEGGHFVGTNVLWHVKVPLHLPPITVDMNRVGNLQYVGYTLFGVITAFALGLIAWVYLHREVRVINVSQPKFLGVIVLGVVIMASCMIPLGMDDFDNGGVCTEDDDSGHCVAICMGVPWTASIGFVLTFSAMYAKLRRINAIFKTNGAGFSRVKVEERDVLPPLIILMTINVTILTCWTVIDPLVYHREADSSRDEWNRVISTYGVCSSDNAAAYLVPLILVNFGVLILANWQSYAARNLDDEFAESRYINLCMASMLQAMLSGVPILFFVQDLPQAYYMVFVLLTFIICTVILLVIFVPKLLSTHEFLKLTPAMQSEYLNQSIKRNTSTTSRSGSGGSSKFLGGSSSALMVQQEPSWKQQECMICAARARVEAREAEEKAKQAAEKSFKSTKRNSRRRSSLLQLIGLRGKDKEEPEVEKEEDKNAARNAFQSTAADFGENSVALFNTEYEEPSTIMEAAEEDEESDDEAAVEELLRSAINIMSNSSRNLMSSSSHRNVTFMNGSSDELRKDEDSAEKKETFDLGAKEESTQETAFSANSEEMETWNNEDSGSLQCKKMDPIDDLEDEEVAALTSASVEQETSQPKPTTPPAEKDDVHPLAVAPSTESSNPEEEQSLEGLDIVEDTGAIVEDETSTRP